MISDKSGAIQMLVRSWDHSGSRKIRPSLSLRHFTLDYCGPSRSYLDLVEFGRVASPLIFLVFPTEKYGLIDSWH